MLNLNLARIPWIVDNILDHLIDPTRTSQPGLPPCSLVCKEWSDHVQKRIFRSVTLNLLKVDTFNEILNESPRLCRYIKEITLRVTTRWPHASGAGLQENEVKRIGDIFLGEIQPRLTSVEHVRIDKVRLDPWQPEAKPSVQSILTGAFPDAPIFSLRSVVFRTFEDMKVFIYSHQNIRELRLNDISWSLVGVTVEDIRTTEIFPPTLSNLTSICYISKHPGIFVDWILGMYLTQSIENITISVENLEDVEASERMTSPIAGELHSLEVQIHGDWEGLDIKVIGELPVPLVMENTHCCLNR
ncbi:hypothetical protein M422DRAFT_261361 [Sphaerobolus stellatus SS14]|uniref:F-box domain-containing protein n=1 Tax=Sphaerobolus stellatus (strain SS14) TaxID=990650 RepID=A0A0C9V398_SPHS4|nr:hypothetical protein M422DRAFT_261361 [Sphaerobolus stellatus SS14]